MPVDEKLSPEMQAFYDELLKTSIKIGQKHGIDIPPFNMFERNGVLIANLTGYKGKAENFWKQAFKEHSKSLGLEPGWIGCEYMEPVTGENFKVIGLDIDGGPNCIRVRDSSGTDFHISPATLIDRITNHVII
ncbi:hypothetical protein [Vibrio owensii]|uniref:hypothetical protein n=1 Tax=Vibrio harveyi group TaxID=717610 RepID=UPI003CC5A232